MMQEWEIILLTTALIFAAVSIGIWIWNVNSAKKMRRLNKPTKINNKPNKYPFKLQNFILYFGGIENIKTTIATNNKIEVIVIDHEKVDLNVLKKIKNRGILDQSDAITLVLGSYCKNLSTDLNELIKLNTNNTSNY